jgi:hypothetical protein
MNVSNSSDSGTTPCPLPLSLLLVALVLVLEDLPCPSIVSESVVVDFRAILSFVTDKSPFEGEEGTNRCDDNFDGELGRE